MVKCRINLNTVLADKVMKRVSDPVHFSGTESGISFEILTVKLGWNQKTKKFCSKRII